MTKVEFFEMVINGDEITEVMKQYAQSELEKIEIGKQKRRERTTEKQKTNTVIKERILKLLKEDGKQSVRTIADVMELSTQKISALMGQLVKDGYVTTQKEKFKESSTKVYTYEIKQ